MTSPRQFKLDELFASQRNLQENAYGYDFRGMAMEDRVEYIRWNSVSLFTELGEMLGEVGWKPWATNRFINRPGFIGEGVDVLKFLLNMLLAANVTADELFDAFNAKTTVNHRRQAAGYDGVSGKCTACGRAEDEPHKNEVA